MNRHSHHDIDCEEMAWPTVEFVRDVPDLYALLRGGAMSCSAFRST